MKRLVDTYHPETIVSGKRTIRDGSRFNPYFPPPDERDRVIMNDSEVFAIPGAPAAAAEIQASESDLSSLNVALRTASTNANFTR